MVVALLASGCASVPRPQSEPVAVSVSWEVSPTDSCPKLAGFLAMVDLFGVGIDRAYRDAITAELDGRCPGDTEPEALDLEVIVPASACGELAQLLTLASAFDVAGLVAPDRRRMVDDLLADLEDEIDRRCGPEREQETG